MRKGKKNRLQEINKKTSAITQESLKINIGGNLAMKKIIFTDCFEFLFFVRFIDITNAVGKVMLWCT